MKLLGAAWGPTRCVHHMAPLENDLSGHAEHRVMPAQLLTQTIHLNNYSETVWPSDVFHQQNGLNEIFS